MDGTRRHDECDALLWRRRRHCWLRQWSLPNLIPQGGIALVDAYVYEVGETSVTQRVRCFRENHEAGDRTLTSDAKMVSVAVDEDGDPVSVPELQVETDAGQRLLDEARNAER